MTSTQAAPAATGARVGRTRAAAVVRWGVEAAAGVVLAAAFGFGYFTGTLGLVLGVGVMLAAVGSAVTLLIAVRAGRVRWRAPWRNRSGWHLAQTLNRLVFWPLAGLAAALSVTTAAVTPGQARLGTVIGWGAVALLLGDALFPRRRILVVPNVAMLAGSIFLGAQLVRLATPVTDAVILDSPVRGEWDVGSGGRSVLVNHHYPVAQQRHAVDLVMARHGASGSTDPRTFPAFGQTVYAPAAGTVVAIRDDLRDLPVGTADRARPEGNHVVLDIGGNRYVLLAHLERGSAAVAEGQRVSAGQPIARVGNSGNTAEPHLHIQVQDGPRLIARDRHGWTEGLRTFPIELRTTVRIRGGARTTPAVDLRRNDILQTP